MNRKTSPAFDHCFTPDKGHRFLERLRRAGFTLQENAVEHPGARLCRFISLAAPGSGARQYLEFVSAPGKSARPGLSLRSREALSRRFKRLRSNRCLCPVLRHRAYDWKSYGSRRRPGWNFLSFRRAFPAAEVWFTEYERVKEATPSGEAPPRHANGCLGVVGLQLDINASGRRYFEGVLERKIEDAVKLDCGTELIFTRSRRNRFRSVILRAADFKLFCRRARPSRVFSYRGSPAARIANPSGSWELLIV